MASHFKTVEFRAIWIPKNYFKDEQLFTLIVGIVFSSEQYETPTSTYIKIEKRFNGKLDAS